MDSVVIGAILSVVISIVVVGVIAYNMIKHINSDKSEN